MKWTTRPDIHIDRAASAWLISAFIDPDAEFVYAPSLDDVPEGTTPYDMRGANLSHRGPDITFETILRDYELDDPTLWSMARIIHEADVEDGLFDAPEAAGLDLIVRALSANHDDEVTRVMCAQIFDAIYAYINKGCR